MKKVLCLIGLLLTVGAGSTRAQDDVEALKRRIAELEALTERLSNQLEGASHPINLARTKHARVAASSVNGNRSLADPYYGVRNAFDNGESWVGAINYSTWLSSGESQPWIEVRFDEPMSITAIEVDRGPAYSAQLFFAAGGEKSLPEGRERTTLSQAVAGVVRVRLHFRPEEAEGNVQVHEVRVFGHGPGDEPAADRAPRLHLTDRSVETLALEAYRAWLSELFEGATAEVESGDDGDWRVAMRKDGRSIAVVRVDSEGAVELEPLVELVDIPR